MARRDRKRCRAVGCRNRETRVIVLATGTHVRLCAEHFAEKGRALKPNRPPEVVERSAGERGGCP